MFNGNPSNKQEVLDYVFGKMIEQGKKCFDGDRCKYRFNGLKCVAGHLLPDSEYHWSMEGEGAQQIEWFKYSGIDLNLLVALQIAHDSSFNRLSFIENIKNITDIHKLKMPNYPKEWLNGEW